MTGDERFLTQALNELLEQDDGVNPNSPIPIVQQLEAKKAQYQAFLELKPFKDRIQKSIEIIQTSMSEALEKEEYDQLLSEIATAADILKEHPEKQGNELGISQKTLDALFNYAEKKLKEGVFADACAILTLLTVLDRKWFRFWFFLGVSLQEQNNFEEAIKAYTEAAQIADKDPLLHLFFAECYCALSDMQHAQLHFDTAKTIMGSMPQNSEWERIVSEVEAKVKI